MLKAMLNPESLRRNPWVLLFGDQTLFSLLLARKKLSICLTCFSPMHPEGFGWSRDVACSAAWRRELLRWGACLPKSQSLFCLCSMWGDPAGHNRKFFCTWFPKWLPFLLPLCLEDIGHSGGKGRCETTSGNDIAFFSWVRCGALYSY